MTDDASDDVKTLRELGYPQELARVLSRFSNFALSLSIICILAGGVTSFHIGFCAAGGAAIGLGWPLVCLLSLCVAATMGQVASAFPTAGGLYHWSAILGGRGWGWATAWFNLAGLVAVLAAINVGTVQFASAAFVREPLDPLVQFAVVAAITASHALFNHLGIGVTRRLTDFSGYLILVVATAITLSLLIGADTLDFTRLVTLANFTGSGIPGEKPVWPRSESASWAFALAILLPAYTITGFDASAHAAEETIGASTNVPKGIVRSVLVSGVFGWVMLAALVVAMKDPAATAEAGDGAFAFALASVVPPVGTTILCAGAILAQCLCGLATLTSASRVAFAFARDGGMPGAVRRISPRFRSPAVAIWCVAFAAMLFTIYTPVYSTIAAVSVILLYISYVLPTAIGCVAYGRSWTEFGPWKLGFWFRPLAIVSILACGFFIVIGMQPPNEAAAVVVGGFVCALSIGWLVFARYHFPGPPWVSTRDTGVESSRKANEFAFEPREKRNE